MKYDWNNLYYSCPHCNNTKSDKYQPLLNCLDPSIRMIDQIEYLFDYMSIPSVAFSAKVHLDSKTKNTIQLLKDVHCGTTDHKIMEAGELRKKVLDELLKLKEAILANNESEISSLLSKESEFISFKVWYIRSIPHLTTKYAQYLNWIDG